MRITRRTPALAVMAVALLTALAGCTDGRAPTAASVTAAPGSGTATTAPATTGPAGGASPKPGTVAGTAGAQPAGTAAEVAAARAMLAALPVGGRGPMTGYDRTGEFGPAWADVDGNGCGTRDDVLARDLTDAAKRDRCVVVAGVLHDPYTGTDIDFRKANAIAVQIDHVFPLGLAWQLGAAQWPQGERVAFANDPANLLAVDGPANEQKSDSGPDGWLPPNKPYRCTYVIHFTRVASLYGLRITTSMRDAIGAQLGQCGSVVGDPAGLQPLPRADWARAAALGGGQAGVPAGETPSPAFASGAPAADGSVYYPNCAAVRAAGKAPLHRGDPGYRPALDANSDGVACS